MALCRSLAGRDSKHDQRLTDPNRVSALRLDLLAHGFADWNAAARVVDADRARLTVAVLLADRMDEAAVDARRELDAGRLAGRRGQAKAHLVPVAPDEVRSRLARRRP